MSRHTIPRWLQFTLIGLLATGGTVLVVGPQIPVPHPWVYGPAEAAAHIIKAEQNQRWVHTHAYGALSAQRLELEEIRVRGDAMPEALQTTYYDGVAHHQRFEFDALDRWLEEVQTHIPDTRQRFFYDGIMRVFAAQHGENPSTVMDFSRELTKKTGVQDLSNGIRIGIQQGFGDDISEAITIAKRYPEELQYPLYEELGWRVGTDVGADIDAWQRYQSELPPNTTCWFVEGMVRGRTILTLGQSQTWWTQIEQFGSSLPKDCGPEIASGVAEALLIVLGDNPVRLQLQLNDITTPQEKELVIAMLDTKQSRTERPNLEPLPGADPNLAPLQ